MAAAMCSIRGEAGLPEAVLIAGFGGFKVIAVEYRMPPEAYFRRRSTTA